jgi:selenocysteine-specific elongation factor
VIRRAGHRPALPPNLQAAGARLRTALSAKPYEPPSRSDLAADSVSQQALRFLLDTQEAIEISKDLVMASDALASATQAIRDFLGKRPQGRATLSELRQLLGTNRRVIVPLAEYLDRHGITQRVGDERILKEPR